MTPPPPGFSGAPASFGIDPAGNVLGKGWASTPFGSNVGGGLARLLNRRRPSNFLMMRKKRKPKSLEEMQMMQGSGDESAP